MRSGWQFALRFWLPAIGLMAFAAQAGDDFGIVAGAEWQPVADEVLIDSRPLADCRQAALPAARCLPAADFIGPHRRLPSERDLLWLLGTAGLDGSEAVLVVGQDATARDFLAGLLHLAGQRRVRILQAPVARMLAGRSDAAPGRQRGMVRAAVFAAPMRAGRLVLKHELVREIETASAVLLDGRSELEYWGESVRGARGGHLPGAILLPATALASAGSRPALPANRAIAYAHDAYEGIAYFTRLAAGQGLDVRVYPGGWAEWAADGSLSADAATYPERRAETPAPPAPMAGAFTGVVALAAAIAVLAAFAGGWLLSRKRVA